MTQVDDLNLICAIDQGTSSSRFLVFNSANSEVVASHQVEYLNTYPKHGWIEQDPMVLLKTVDDCIANACEQLKKKQISLTCIKGIGITNQRETTIIWDKKTGKPLYNAIIWADNRTQELVDSLIQKTKSKSKNEFVSICGLPITTYFSAVKLCWIMNNDEKVKKELENGNALFGTVDSWLLWNYTGGKHITDVTNASRTMLMNLKTLEWDNEVLNFFKIPKTCLPKIVSCSEEYGKMASGPLKGVLLCGCLGDQQAALVGHSCFKNGDAKNTYGTGCFMLQNVGKDLVLSKHGLLSTIGYKLGPNEPTYYALEGSVAVAGSLIKWLRDGLKIIKTSSEIEVLANKAGGSYGMAFVPAFSGLYAPHWRSDARGTICGLTQFHTQEHIAYAALEAVCFQTKEIIDAMKADSGVASSSLQVDGGMTANKLLMQLQADILNCTVLMAKNPETTALGAAMAAGKHVGVWKLSAQKKNENLVSYKPKAEPEDIAQRYEIWKLAVEKSVGWKFSSNQK